MWRPWEPRDESIPTRKELQDEKVNAQFKKRVQSLHTRKAEVDVKLQHFRKRVKMLEEEREQGDAFDSSPFSADASKSHVAVCHSSLTQCSLATPASLHRKYP